MLLRVISVNFELYDNIYIHDASGSVLLSVATGLLLDGSLCILESARDALELCSSAPDTALGMA